MAEFYGVQTGSAQATPTMIRVIRICRKCGAKIFSDVPEGLCPRCVLKSALGNFPDTVAGVADPGRPASAMPATAPDDRASASQQQKQRKLQSCSESWAITNCWKKSVAAVRAWCFARGKKVSIAQSR